MELKDFVSCALRDIIGGVAEAAKDLDVLNAGAKISPLVQSPNEKQSYVVRPEDGGGVAFIVDFDLSIEVNETSGSARGGSAKLRIMSAVQLGGDSQTEEADSRTIAQRIKFSVPVKFPQTSPSEPRLPRVPTVPSSGWT